MKFEPVIGLEVHAQLATNSKMFCSCPTTFGERPNRNTCPVCLGLPGALPKINGQAIRYAIMLGLATNCKIREDSVFARKNYFYPDLPKSYQTSQFDKPICENGWVDITVGEKVKRIGITRIHMEEDAGKLTHEGSDPSKSYVDLNRAGVPLLEIVSEPELRTPEEAKAYMEKIHSLVTHLGVCNGDMEKGNLRCDANISIRPVGETKFGTRTETKNLNSFRFVQQAIEYEIGRQTNAVLDGEKIVQETRLFDSVNKTTFVMRTKENADDYRYFPCPDLPVARFDKALVDEIRENLPELPDKKMVRYAEQYGLNDYDAALMCAERAVSDFFEAVVAAGCDPKKTVNWISGDIFRMLNDRNQTMVSSVLEPKHLIDLLKQIDSGAISGKIAKTVFEEVFETGKMPGDIVKEKGLEQVSDSGLIREICEKVVSSNPDQVAAYKGGRDKLFGFFVGQVMKSTGGKANPQLINEILKQLLDS